MPNWLKAVFGAIGAGGLISIIAIAVSHYDATHPVVPTPAPSLALQCFWGQMRPQPDIYEILYQQPGSATAPHFVGMTTYSMRFVGNASVDTCILNDDSDVAAYNVQLTFAYRVLPASQRETVNDSNLPDASLIVERVPARSEYVIRFVDDFPSKDILLAPTTQCFMSATGKPDIQTRCSLPRMGYPPPNFSQDAVILFHYRSATDCWGLNPVALKYQARCRLRAAHETPGP